MSTDELKGLSLEQKRAIVARLLRERATAAPASAPTVPEDALAYGQRALWFINRLAPTSAAYNVAMSAWVRSELDTGALEQACQDLVARHPVLRTTFVERDGRPSQQVHDQAPPFFGHVNATDWSDAQLRQRVEAAYTQPFDLEQGPLLRVRVFTRRPTEHVLLLIVHHIVVDGWSMRILLEELQSLYAAVARGISANLPTAAASYHDFVAWQHQQLTTPAGARLRDYWLGQLTGELPVLSLPLDRPRPAVQSFNGAIERFSLTPETFQALGQVARREHVTLHTVLLSAYILLLHRWSGQDDLLVGSTAVGRSRPEFAAVVGDFVDMQVLRADCGGQPTVRELLRRVRETVLAALDHAGYPFLALVRQLRVPPDASRSPLYQVAFDLQRMPRSMRPSQATGEPKAVDIGGLALEPYPLDQQAGLLDLHLQVIELDQQAIAELKFNTDLFTAASMARFADQYQVLLSCIGRGDLDQPIDRLPLLSPDAHAEIVDRWNATAMSYPAEIGVHELVEQQARRTPAAPAVVFESQLLTYAELEQRARELALALREAGVAHGDRVALHLGRSADLPVAILGVLKAGAAYVPLDPSFPPDRLAYMLADSGAVALVTQSALRGSLGCGAVRELCIDALAPTNGTVSYLGPPARGEDLAYLIYTSGSTGRPKGVEIPHRAVVNFLTSMCTQPGLDANDVLLAVTTLSFDIAVLELLLPLTVGARVHIAPNGRALDGPALATMLAHAGATVMQATPVTWRLLVEAGWQSPRGFRALCGGEPLPPDLAQSLLVRGVQLWNLYGPTETTVWSTIEPVRSSQASISVGRPIANTEVLVVDDHHQLAPVGVVGELWIAGDGLARGYHGLPELTGARFVPHPLKPDTRAYRTGDLARWRSDGRIDLLGRADQQVKLRGFRIELGEIEVVLAQHPAVQQAVVVVRNEEGPRRLIAYFTVHGAAPTVDDLRRHLRARLADYMVPSALVRLDAFPLTPTGKVDRRALPAPGLERPELEAHFVAPRDDLERRLASVWQRVLNVDQVGVHDSFFELGGDSLLIVQVQHQLNQELDRPLDIATLFQHPSIDSLPRFLRQPRTPGVRLERAHDRASRQRAALERLRRPRSDPQPEVSPT